MRACRNLGCNDFITWISQSGQGNHWLQHGGIHIFSYVTFFITGTMCPSKIEGLLTVELSIITVSP